jgi:non-heme chloroperoxidase
MTSSAPVPAVLIHGLWLHASSWDNWISLFGERGYQPIAPGWPGDSATAEETRENPEPAANHGIAEITDHFAAIITALPAPPVIIGHSFGGLITERLMGLGLGRAGVAIAPAQFHGVHRLPIVQLESAWPVLRHPSNRTRAVPLTRDEFAGNFANAIPREEADALYDQYAIPSPALPLFEGAASAYSAKSDASVDTAHERGPLLMIAGGSDRTVPSSTVYSAYKIQQKNPATTEYKLFPDRGHSQPVDHGWREIADCALDFLACVGVPGTPTAPAIPGAR